MPIYILSVNVAAVSSMRIFYTSHNDRQFVNFVKSGMKRNLYKMNPNIVYSVDVEKSTKINPLF